MTRVAVLDVTGELMEDGSFEHILASPKQFANRIAQNPYYFRVVYHAMDVNEDATWIINTLWVSPAVPRWIVLDEIHEVCPLSGLSPEVNMLLRYSRHRQIGVIGASQRIADVSKLYTGACRMVVLFHTEESRDLDAIDDRWGDKAANDVRSLRPLIYVDAEQRVVQTPQCLVITRGVGTEIIDL